MEGHEFGPGDFRDEWGDSECKLSLLLERLVILLGGDCEEREEAGLAIGRFS